MTEQSALIKQQPERIGVAPEIWLENELFEQTTNYLKHGRRYQFLSIDQLNEGWAKAFRQFVQWRPGPHTRDMDDVGAELRLRGKGFPIDLVREEVEQLRAFIKHIGRLPLCN